MTPEATLVNTADVPLLKLLPDTPLSVGSIHLQCTLPAGRVRAGKRLVGLLGLEPRTKAL
jgi:hypothetical protein